MQTELTLQERRQLLAILRELDPAAPGERRGSKRRKVAQKLWIRQINRGPGGGVNLFQGMLRNASVRGLGVEVRRALVTGDKLMIPLRFDDGGGWLVLAEVRNCRKLENGRHAAGLLLVDRVEDPDGEAKVPMDWIL